MATTTTNFGWDIPQSTDLVKDGATAIAALGQDIDTALVDLKGGTSGQVLAKASGTDLDFSWVAQDDSNAIQNAIVDAKGDLIAATANDTPARLAVGTNGQVLSADSAEATGLKWATVSSGSLTLIQTQAFSAVSSQSLTSKFSATYDNYRLYYNITSASASTDFAFRVRSSTTDLTSAVYNWKYAFYQIASSDGTSTAAADTKIFLGYTTASAAGYVDILNPFLSQKTALLGASIDQSTPTGRTVYANVNNTTSYDGLTIFPATGTITGTVSLYGFNN
jgi:hypothetical protein